MSGEEKQTEKKVEPVPDPDLDSLLDEAIQDFNKPRPAPQAAAPNVDLAAAMAAMGAGAAASQGGNVNQNIWTEEFIQQATSNFENTMRAIMEQQLGTAPAQSAEQNTTTEETSHAPLVAAENNENKESAPEAPVDLSAMSAEFSKFAEAAAKAANEVPSDADFTQCLSETLKQLNQNNEQLKSVPNAEDLSKMFENFGLGEGGGGEDAPMGGLFPLMQVMLENILSKEVLYPPMKEITDKYPDWLADNRSSLSEEEYARYNKQYDIMKQVVQLYEEEQDTDTDEIKGQRFEKVMKAMQQLQEMGQPPKDLVGDMGPMINFDESGNPVLPDVSTLLGAAGFPGAGGMGMPTGAMPDGSDTGSQQPQPGQEQCSLM